MPSRLTLLKMPQQKTLPLIGISSSEIRRAQDVHQTPEGEPRRTELALGYTYLHAVERAGGLPVILPPLGAGAIEPLLDRLSAVCLSGGPDLDPGSYGGRLHSKLGPTEPEIDRFELAVARHADARGMPVLAICRGAQTLNVARGGTLIMDLPSRRKPTLKHRQDEIDECATHPVEVLEGSHLAEVLDSTKTTVNSFHHQAVRRLGRGLRAVAWAPDGVIEAVEDPTRDFMIGVQWHAESLVSSPESERLFSAFIEAAERYAAEAPRVVAA